jgi:hypothetical protein
MAITNAQQFRQMFYTGGSPADTHNQPGGSSGAPDAVTGGDNDYYDQRFQTVVSPPPSQTGSGPYDDNETILSNILGGINRAGGRIGNRIRGFATGAKNYLSNPSNRRGLLTNVALTSLFGPIGMLIAGLARSSRVRDALKGNKNLDTSVIDDGTIDQRFLGITPDLLQFIDKDKQITESPYPSIDPRQASFNLDLFPGAKVIPVKNYTKEDLEKLGAAPGRFFGANEQLEALEDYYNFAQKQFGRGKDPSAIRDSAKIGSSLYGLNLDLVPKDFLETEQDFKQQKSPFELLDI